MSHIVSRVTVKDFDRFIEVFSTRGKAKRAEHGSRGVRLYRSAEDPTQLVNVFDWDREGAEAFMADPESADIMKAAGLEAPPELTFVEQVGEYEA
jgi:heme-degrading monooxygenase HmoA